MTALLFPDSCYGFISGGDPKHIPDLTYDSFVEQYKRYYHPSNSYFYLDGDVPLDATLTKIDEYISGFDRLDDVPELAVQKPVKSGKIISYAASGEDDKPLICLGKIISSWEDRDKMLALSVILEQISDSNESPLKRAVLSSGLAEDMEIYISDGIAQPYLMMLFRGISDEKSEKPDADSLRDIAERLVTIVEETVNKITEDGFSRRDLEASVNQTDFRFRQYPEPQALYRMISAYSSWLYGGDPALYLATDSSIAKVRSMIDKGEMEGIAREILADTSMLSTIILMPDSSYAAKEAAVEAARVKAEIEALDGPGREQLEELNRKLLEWQQTDDSEEALATIPQLDIADIDPMPQLIPTEEKDVCGAKILFHQLPSNGIVHINAYFPVTQLALSELPAAALITEFFRDLPTEKYDVLTLQNEIRMYIGGISFSRKTSITWNARLASE